MAVNAVQRNEYRSNQASYTKAAGIGALSGYALKYVLPLTQQEKDEMNSDKVDFKRFAKMNAIEGITKDDKVLGRDEFLGLCTNKKLTAGEINALGEPKRTQVFNIIKTINEKARVYAESAFVAIKKHLRPAKTFIAVGAAVALSTAFVYNVLGKMSEK